MTLKPKVFSTLLFSRTCDTHKRIIRNFHKQKGEQKEMVTNSKPDFNNIEKASKIMMGIIMEFHLDGTRQGMFVHDGIRQAG